MKGVLRGQFISAAELRQGATALAHPAGGCACNLTALTKEQVARWPKSLVAAPYALGVLECRTKIGKGWQQLCGGVATHIEVAVINDVSYGIVSCDEHHNPSAMPIGNKSDDELRDLCRNAGLTPGF